MGASNKVFFNTAVLYGRMLITIGITLYTTRLVLNALGEVNFGIFNLIAGIILMLSFLNAAMTTSTQRYLSFYQGKKDLDMQKAVFSNSLILHFAIGILVVACLELAGIFLFDGLLNIPANRVEAAKTIYHFMSITVFFTILGVPFNGSLVAHENMLWIAVVNIVETVLKLGIAIYLFYVTSDRLVTYGLLTAGISVISFCLYAWFCLVKYKECSLKLLNVADRDLMKELGSFAGWNLFGALCSVGRTQGVAVLLNLSLGAVVNAAYGIANQVASQMNFFSSTMQRALNPQIMKSEGAGQRERMLRLAMISSKFGFFLLSIIAIPCIFEMDAILTLWLKKVPQYSVIFCSLILVSTMMNQLTVGLQSAAQATGKIKYYQAVVGSTLLLNLPVTYILLNLDFPVEYVLAGFSVVEGVACVLRLFFLKKIANLSIRKYFDNVIFKEIIPIAVIIIVGYLITRYLNVHNRFLITLPVSAFSYCIAIYFFGLCSDEKSKLDEKIHHFWSILESKLNPSKIKRGVPHSK